MDQCNKFYNFIVSGWRLTKDENGKPCDATSYKQMVEIFMYLLTSRPYLAYLVCLVAIYIERPTEIHLETTKRI